MKRLKSYIPKIFAIFMITALVMVNLQVNDSSPSFDDLTANSAYAGPVYDDMELRYTVCWETGEDFLKCFHGDYVCDASDQGYCGPEDDPQQCDSNC